MNNSNFAIKSSRSFLLAAFTFMCFMLTLKLPLLGMIAIPLCGLFAFISIVSCGYAYFISYAILTSLATMMLTRQLTLGLFPFVFMPALFLAFGLKLKVKPLNAICLALLSSILFSVGFVTTLDYFVPPKEKESQKVLLNQQTQLIEKQFNDIVKKNPDSEEAVKRMKPLLDQMVYTLKMLVPTMSFFVMHLISLGIIYLGACMLSSRLGFTIESLPEFRNWEINWNLIWLYIVGLLFYYILPNYPQITSFVGITTETVKTIGINSLVISSFIYYIIGFSLLFFMFNKYQANIFTRVSLSFLALIFSQIIVWFAIINVWAEFRQPKSTQWFGSDDSNSDSGLFY